MDGAWLFASGTTKHESLVAAFKQFGRFSYKTYMAALSATTKIETLMITVCWTEFHIKNL